MNTLIIGHSREDVLQAAKKFVGENITIAGEPTVKDGVHFYRSSLMDNTIVYKYKSLKGLSFNSVIVPKVKDLYNGKFCLMFSVLPPSFAITKYKLNVTETPPVLDSIAAAVKFLYEKAENFYG